MKANHPWVWFALLLGGANFCGAAEQSATFRPPPDRAHWPTALRDVPLERLSSGALLRLDVEGDLVELPAARVRRTSDNVLRQQPGAPTVALDPRVGANVRLGDDPAALPPNMRAQAEPHIARSPVNSDYLIATFQEGRFTDGSAVNCGYSVSLDGGFTWSRALIPGTTPSSGGAYPRLTDPVAGVASSGNSYLNTLAAGASNSGGTILVSRSTDGNTFGPPKVAFQASANDFPDKNWMAINTFAGTPSAGRIVVTFTQFPAVGAAAYPIMRIYSDNAGETWSPAALVHSSNRQVQGSQPVFLPDGRLVIVYWNFNNTTTFADDFLELVVSPDGGVTFGAPKRITAVNYYDAPAVRDGGFLPSATTDRTTGTLYVAYQALQAGLPKIMFTKSTDAGTTWSTPVAISDNSNSSVFNAAITASPDGRKLAVSFYDTRDNPGSNTSLDVYVANSFDGGASWEPNLRVSSVSTDATLAPLTSGGYMLGDYQGIAEPTNANVPAIPVWVDTRTGNPDPFTARVHIVPPSLDFTRTEFNADGQTDLIWQNRLNGQRGVWLMNGISHIGERFLPTVALEWSIVGTADFNGDGQIDILWENENNGQRGVWFMNGTDHIGTTFLPTVAVEWKIAGVGDFNSDRQVDLVWQNTTTGQRAVWFMNGTSHIGDSFLPTIPLAWEIAAVADFDRDGQADLLWQNNVTGERGFWVMDGTTYIESRFLPSVSLEWKIAGAGEFTGDGKMDILWQNTSTGQRVVWRMEDTIYNGFFFLPTVATEWEIRNK